MEDLPVAEKLADLPTPEEVERRLRELEQLYELGKALREVRFVEEPPKTRADRVREQPAV
jgi:hypothetical protein